MITSTYIGAVEIIGIIGKSIIKIDYLNKKEISVENKAVMVNY